MVRSRSGFTVVELLVVIVVIGILAAVVIVGYGAWRKEMASNSVKNDLKAAVAAMEDGRNFSESGYPAAIPATIQPSSTVQLSGGGRPGGVAFCIYGTSTTDASIQFYVSDKQKEPAQGDCTITTTQLAALAVRVDGLAVSNDGTVYAPDGTVIQKVTSNGTATILAGTQGVSGNTNGPIATATFTAPRGTAIATDGSIYVADINGNSIRKISADQTTVSTFSQSSVHATDVAVGTDGNIYALEGDNYAGALFRLNSDGVVTKIAGNATNASTDGQGTAASFWDPRGLTQRADGTIFVCDNGSGLIRKVTKDVVVTTYAGQGTVYPGGATTAIAGACGGVVAGPRNSLYVSSGSKLYVISADGTVGLLASLPTTGMGLALNSSGDLWLATSTKIYKITMP